MKETLQSLLEHLRRTNGPTRVVIGVGIAVVVLIGAYAGYKASNPYMTFLMGNLDSTEFSTVTSALSREGIRFDTSTGGAPYTVFVESGRKYDALNAIHLDGTFSGKPRGIETSADSSAVFLGHDERTQKTQARYWQEVEKQLEQLNWIAAASVKASAPSRSPIRRNEPQHVSVVLTLRGLISPDRAQRQAVGALVQNAFGVPAENIVIADQHGNALFDGAADDALDEMLRFEEEFTDTWTRRAQARLDTIFGPDLTSVSVTGEWDHQRQESVQETVTPSKAKTSETTSETKTPVGGGRDGRAGGPAGVQANLADATPIQPRSKGEGEATTTEATTEYENSLSTTYLSQFSPVLKRLSVSLLVDESIADQLDVAEGYVKGVIGYDEERDQFQKDSTLFKGIERDSDGNPVDTGVAPAKEPTNPTITLLLERGVEILAAAAFLFLLLRSLKRSKAAADTDADQAEGSAEDEEVQLELLARRQVEDMVENEPEKVAQLLTHWAADERQHAGAGR